MKKIYLIILAFLCITMSSFAAAYSSQSNVAKIGSQLLSKNGLPTVTFNIVDTETSNTDVSTTKKLYITNKQLNYTGNDNEVAVVIAQELGAVINYAASKKEIANNVATSLFANVSGENLQNTAMATQQFLLNNVSLNEQMNADITGVDLMINAGYNPLAMIVVLGKSEGSVTDTLKGQPNNFKRTMNIYNYLSYNYPEKVKAGYACQEYKTFLEYIQPTIDKRNSNKTALEKFKKEQAKAKKDREKQLLKYKATNGSNPWNIANKLINK